MAYERKDLDIDGMIYSILPPPVQPDGIRLALRTTTLLGGLLGVLGESASGKSEAIQKFSTALASVDPDKAQALLTDAVAASKLHCNNEPIFKPSSFEIHFGDKRAEVFQVMVWCLWECVKDFLPQTLLSILSSTVEKGASVFQQTGSQNTGSEGPSGKDSVVG